MSHCHMPEGIDAFTADGLTFGVRISDGLVAVAAGDKEASARLVVRRLEQEVTTPTDPSRTTLDPGTETSSITLMVAQKCNLRCTYCYGVNGEYGSPGMLDFETAHAVIADFMGRAGTAERNINFFGGEPVLAMTAVRHLTYHALRLGLHFDRLVSFSMTTNATLITEEIAAWLAHHLFSVVVSIDGDPALHGSNRPDALGRSSWEATVRGARHLLRFLGPERILARATLTAAYPEIEQILSNLREIGLTRIALASVEPSPRGTAGAWTPEEYKRYRSAIGELVSENLHPGGRQLPWNPLQDTLELLARGTRRDRACGVGNNARALSADGHLYPCHRYVGDARFQLGSEGSSRVDSQESGGSRFEENRRRALEECQSCVAKAFCAGGCAHVALQRMDLGLPPHDPDECDFIRWKTREAIRIFASHYAPPAQGSAALLGPDYTHRPVSTETFRQLLQSVLPALEGGWGGSSLHRIADAAYASALEPLTKWLSELGEDPPPVVTLEDHDWLTTGLPLHLANRGILSPLTEEDAVMIGLAAAIAAYVQGLSRLRRNQETVRLAWADAYTQTLTTASELSCWKHLVDLLRRFFPQHVFARIAEVGRADPGFWKEVNGAKHCALALPALLIATTHGLTSVVEEVAGFASMAGPLRQYLDDYADVLEDLCDKKFNWWAHELAQWAGDIRQSQWPQVLAHRSVAHIIGRRIESDARSVLGAPPWIRSALQTYVAWLLPQIETVRRSWASQNMEMLEGGNDEGS